MEPFFNKTYVLERSENFNELMKKCGAGWLLRKIATSAKPKVALMSNSDGTFTYTSAAGILGSKYQFTPSIEFEERAMSGEACRSLITFNGNTMVHTQRGNFEIKIVREYSDDKMVMTIYCEDLIARRYFKADKSKK